MHKIKASCGGAVGVRGHTVLAPVLIKHEVADVAVLLASVFECLFHKNTTLIKFYI